MVLLQPLVWKNISLLIFEDFLFRNNFNSVSIIDSRAPKRFPYRPWVFYGLTATFSFEKYIYLFKKYNINNI